jgi:2,3-bisphosphoglycerate-independent phosphoglycerate mutase
MSSPGTDQRPSVMSKVVNNRPRPVVLCILDGWGLREARENNALAQARLPNWTRLMRTRPWSRIGTSGTDVGLPAGQMGNSEVGHMNIGAGRIAVPDLPRIDNAIADGSFFENPALKDLLAKIKASGGTLHLLGLLSPGGVHSHQDHMAALAKAASNAGVPVAVHAFLDGRDTPPSSAGEYLAQFQRDIAGLKDIRVATISGRYYAMDRDKRWDRVAKAYAALVDAQGERAADPAGAVAAAAARGETDEFVNPTVLDGYTGMRDGDGLVMANFRADRAREILPALLDPVFDGFARGRVVNFAAAAGMAEYSAALNPFLSTMFPPVRYPKTLGEVVADAGMKQLRIAETEKYAHVTFFLNGGEEAVFPGEDRILVPSPKVATYDKQPSMSAPEVTDRLVAAIEAGTYDLIVVNYANPDMVGHTGVMEAAVQAAETVDTCLGRLEAAVEKAGGVLLVSADHGNLEEMWDATSGSPHTQHTTNPVPAVLTGPGAGAYRLADGRLCDLAPTVLHFLGLAQPPEMTGKSLLIDAAGQRSGERAVA